MLLLLSLSRCYQQGYRCFTTLVQLRGTDLAFWGSSITGVGLKRVDAGEGVLETLNPKSGWQAEWNSHAWAPILGCCYGTLAK